MYKLLGSGSVTNSTPSQYANNRIIRIAHTGATAETITLWENTIPLSVIVSNTAANATTLLELTSGNTASVAANMRIMGSSNLAVVNTVVASQVASVVNATAIAANVDIVIANGVAQLWVTDTSKTFTMVPNSEFVIEKARTDFLSSTNNATITGLPVSYRG